MVDLRVSTNTLLKEISQEGLPVSAGTFYRMDRAGRFGKIHRTAGEQRSMGRDEAEKIKIIIWKNYFGDDYVKYRKSL